MAVPSTALMTASSRTSLTVAVSPVGLPASS